MGQGIVVEDKEKFFLLYYLIKGCGIGFGFVIVYCIVVDYYGMICVEDNLLQGFVFIIEIFQQCEVEILNMISCIFIIDDEIGICEILLSILQDEGYEVVVVEIVKQVEVIIGCEYFDFVIFDIWFFDGDGFEFFECLCVLYFDWFIVMILGYVNIDSVVKVICFGVYDFFEKLLLFFCVVFIVQYVFEQSQFVWQFDVLLIGFEQDELFIGESEGMCEFKDQLVMVVCFDL